VDPANKAEGAKDRDLNVFVMRDEALTASTANGTLATTGHKDPQCSDRW